MKNTDNYMTWISFDQYFDLDGNPVERTRDKYPYSYDPYVVFKSDSFKREEMTSVYSDRLLQWDLDKFNDSRKKVDGTTSQYFNLSQYQCQLFLRYYYDDPNLELHCILEGCNVSNGFPYWVFFFKSIV